MPPRIDIQDLLIWAFQTEGVETTPTADPDALTVYWAVLALPVPHATMIRRFAREARRPDWHAVQAQCVSLEAVRRSRRLYTEWVRALIVLQRTLDGTLSSFSVTGPNLDEQPWMRERVRLEAAFEQRTQ
ncbi:hypothetical protein PRN20_12230 [Devosia sp. ZB163]|uniref:hypothetical protein n=1 Tax=Devosia sp. ZB163 TaxID=3025938 RepID=UPI00236178C7|nr:hypothetical protein [Devosia sp. ZB163]MDC9824502.1 hypothetical protein [Devosia sp. ZB163]